MFRQKKRGIVRRRANPRVPREPTPDPGPPRFKTRIEEKAELEKELHKRNRPGTAVCTVVDPEPAPAFEPEQDTSESEPEPEDLLKRTKLRYKKAKNRRKEIEAKLRRFKKDDESRDAELQRFLLRDATGWEERYKREYEAAKRGEDRTDFLGRIREREERRLGRPLEQRESWFREPGIGSVPGETYRETYGRIVMSWGYDPDIPKAKGPVFRPRRSQRLTRPEGEAQE
ncbi:hypothetical protein PRZ48_012544 [Zasmidium cellare]|uniref:Uncharacterized protein n=1 Tax=Zasmidium cellare TaxID=395010 RepID=A0ABR0E561_ZASCE|nr:hypothetical protein PRZ48_012544 [Zasmidium cellare]